MNILATLQIYFIIEMFLFSRRGIQSSYRLYGGLSKYTNMMIRKRVFSPTMNALGVSLIQLVGFQVTPPCKVRQNNIFSFLVWFPPLSRSIIPREYVAQLHLRCGRFNTNRFTDKTSRNQPLWQQKNFPRKISAIPPAEILFPSLITLK